jgi:hypothetical protein
VFGARLPTGTVCYWYSPYLACLIEDRTNQPNNLNQKLYILSNDHLYSTILPNIDLSSPPTRRGAHPNQFSIQTVTNKQTNKQTNDDEHKRTPDKRSRHVKRSSQTLVCVLSCLALFFSFFSTVYWSIGQLVNWSIGQLVNWSIGQLVNWSIGQLVNWSIGQLVNWSIGLLLIADC